MKGVKTLCALALLGAFLALPLRAQQPAAPSAAQPFGPAPAPDAVTAGGGSKDYPLGPGDVLELRVLGEPQLDGTYDVDDEGKVMIPFVEHPIDARCRYIKDIRKEVITALAKFIRTPQVYMRVKDQRSRRAAFVYGAVRMPLRFEMHRRARLLELISNTGGVTEQANGTIQITHTAESICPEPDEIGDPNGGVQGVDSVGLPFTIYRVADLKLGKAEANPFIRPGDIVYIAEASPIYITGSVVAPQGLYLREELTLTTALAMVGGVRKEAKTSEVRIYRQKAGGGERERMVVDYRAIQKKKAKDVMLQPYDVIEVPEEGAFSARRLPQLLTGLITNGVTGFATNAPLRVLY
jgi:polysaccharide biosynthesis/export protein